MQDQTDITKTGDFKFYKQVLRLHMKADLFPHSKISITSQLITQIVAIINQFEILSLRDMTMYAIMYFGFIRLSKCIMWTQDDMKFDDDEILLITIRDSKTDQEVAGETFHI